MTRPVIEAHQLCKYFGQLCAVDKFDLNIERGTIYGFLGPNGCGKTTAMRMLTGLLSSSSGSIRVLDFELPRDSEKLRTQIGYMTQKFSLYEDLTVKENLQFIARIYCLPRRDQSRRIDELLSTYGLQQQHSQQAGRLSGGQRQRLALAAAVLHKPTILFLDEPTSAVDPENRRDFWEQLFDLCDSGTSILVSTHYMDEAERCHQLAILENGIKRAEGSPQELMLKMGANVLEIEAANLRQLKKKLIEFPEIISSAQIGTHLRILVRDHVEEPELWLRQLSISNSIQTIQQVRPSLEDVFVSCTGRGKHE